MASQLISTQRLTEVCQRILQHWEVPADDALYVAESLVHADLRGIHSHGTLRLARYVRELRDGITNPCPRIAVLDEGMAMARVDGDGGLGQLVGRRAMEVCIAKAQTTGTATVTACRSRHFGVAGAYASMALEADLIGLAMTVASPRLTPTGGAEPLFGNHPIAMAVPGDQDFPLIIDAAMGSIAAGKLQLAAASGSPISPGLARNLDGTPTTDPQAALSGSIVPIGEHKGYGLTLLVEILAGLLSGAPYFGVKREEVGEHMRDKGIGHFFMAIDPSRFMSVPAFRQAVADMTHRLKTSTRMPGVEEILVPGEMEERLRRERLRLGIPLADATVEALRELSGECGEDALLP